jgi:hypothetical protein
MPPSRPRPISSDERLARKRRVARIARRLGFVGRIEYRHVQSQTGGAQYGMAAVPDEDLLTVYAEAFERDADPEEFSLEAIIAHECGHQLLARHPRLSRNLPGSWSGVSEEIVASLLGSLLVQKKKDQEELLLKALFEAERQGLDGNRTIPLIISMRALLEKIL